MKFKLSLLLSFAAFAAVAQEETKVIDTSVGRGYEVIEAGQYKNGKVHRFLFGSHYRKEWGTPVKVQIAMLDTLFGGVTPYEAGGGRQSKSLKLHDKNNREYTMRSLDKSFGRALPPGYQGTFVQALVDDQVTIGHPYSAVTIPDMAEAVGIYHTNPIIRYVPKQKTLDSFSEDFGNRVFLIEKRPDENWVTAPEFGRSENIVGTDKMLEKLLKSNENYVDQKLYARSRLFDLLIGDWGRHEDQWRWAEFDKKNKTTLYQPVPRDRDQAFSVFDGVFPGTVLHLANLDYLRGFKDDIKDVNKYNFTARHLDRRCANELTEQDWVSIAEDMRQKLTDALIEKSVKKLPPEVFPISGPGIIEDLKKRRDQLPEYARTYYAFLARHIDIPGSNDPEHFEVNRLNDEETSVKVFRVNDAGVKADTPFYHRIFKTDETKDLRLYGIEGKDFFEVTGKVNKGIKIRIVGGEDKDSIIDYSRVGTFGHQTKVYDDRNNFFIRSPETRLYTGFDSASHAYNYNEYEYHRKGLTLSLFYNNPDRLYASIGYRFRRHYWRKDPYVFDQAISLRYSIIQNALSLLYKATFYQAIGKWDLQISAFQDFVRWTNFYGLGNETPMTRTDNRYYRLRTNEFQGSVGLMRRIGRFSRFDVSTYFQAIEVIQDSNKFVTDNFTSNALYFFEHHRYVGARAGYSYVNINEPVTPTKGLLLYGGAAYTQNIDQHEKGFATYNGIVQFYIPLVSKFSLSVRSAIESVQGTPEFYQYASTGGSQTLRGYRRNRFWGNTAFYNTNELRWITDFHTRIMNGKFGFIGFFDDGRVWLNGQSSDILHYAYGGGIMLAPFNLANVSLTYGVSEENGLIHVRFNQVIR